MAMVELPIIPIPIFSGKIIDANVHSQRLTNLQKFNYLLQSLRGEAKEAIRRYAVTEENYPVAVEVLRTKFGDKSKLIYDLQVRLERTSATSTHISEQRRLLEYLLALTTQLEQKGVSLNGSFTVQEILAKFKQSLQKKILQQRFETDHREDDWSMSKLLTDLDRLITAEEKVEEMLANNEALQNRSKPSTGQRRNDRPLGRLQSCIYCNSPEHSSQACTKVASIKERTQLLLKYKRCLNCTRSNHLLKECIRRTTQRQNYTASSESPDPHIGKTDQNKEEESTSTFYISNTEPKRTRSKVLLLTGMAKVCDTKSGEMKEVEILLDRGAVRSFITGKLANELNLPNIDSVHLSVYTFGNRAPQKGKQARLTSKDRKYLQQQGITLTKSKKTLSSLRKKHSATGLQHIVAPSKLRRHIACSAIRFVRNTIKLGYLLRGKQELCRRKRITDTKVNVSGEKTTITQLNAQEAAELERWDRYWSLDTCGIEEFTGTKNAEKSHVNKKVEKFFKDTIEKRSDEYYRGIRATTSFRSVVHSLMHETSVKGRWLNTLLLSTTLGWLVPLLIPLKWFQQHLWLQGYSWDHELSQPLQLQYTKMCEDANGFRKDLIRKSSLLMAKSKLPSIKDKRQQFRKQK
ncbi:unnamed protein product [Haemonchus placei]|uniref:DUF1758 domain-containing protein n=1 Tax=Haemonchus placei TaxID=6290 RepID=A0A0N4WCK6_HAEPC|nr:unnamed protein product [Haemonchus placei]